MTPAKALVQIVIQWLSVDEEEQVPEEMNINALWADAAKAMDTLSIEELASLGWTNEHDLKFCKLYPPSGIIPSFEEFMENEERLKNESEI